MYCTRVNVASLIDWYRSNTAAPILVNSFLYDEQLPLWRHRVDSFWPSRLGIKGLRVLSVDNLLNRTDEQDWHLLMYTSLYGRPGATWRCFNCEHLKSLFLHRLPDIHVFIARDGGISYNEKRDLLFDDILYRVYSHSIREDGLLHLYTLPSPTLAEWVQFAIRKLPDIIRDGKKRILEMYNESIAFPVLRYGEQVFQDPRYRDVSLREYIPPLLIPPPMVLPPERMHQLLSLICTATHSRICANRGYVEYDMRTWATVITSCACSLFPRATSGLLRSRSMHWWFGHDTRYGICYPCDGYKLPPFSNPLWDTLANHKLLSNLERASETALSQTLEVTEI